MIFDLKFTINIINFANLLVLSQGHQLLDHLLEVELEVGIDLHCHHFLYQEVVVKMVEASQVGHEQYLDHLVSMGVAFLEELKVVLMDCIALEEALVDSQWEVVDMDLQERFLQDLVGIHFSYCCPVGLIMDCMLVTRAVP